MPGPTSPPNDAKPWDGQPTNLLQSHGSRNLRLVIAMNQALSESSPINRLPREILAEIFSLCVPKMTSESARMLTSNAPLLLCLVCSSWRELALATPKIWTTVGIVIRGRHMDSQDVSAAAHIITTWLKRSGALPLTLSLDYNPYYHNCAKDHTRARLAFIEVILSVFGVHSSRWQDVNLSLCETPSVSWPQLGNLPLLQAFHFDGQLQNVINLTLNGCPRLTRLSGSYPVVALTNPQIPWSQISYLHISSKISLFDASEAIRLCPQLEEFQASLDIPLDQDSRLPRTPIVENHRLRTLRIASADHSPLFSSLTLPSLRGITFRTRDPNTPFFLGFSSLLDLFTRSNCRLDAIRLYDCALWGSDVLQLIEHKSLETVQALCIDNCRNHPMFTDDVLIRLTNFPPAHACRTLLPKLTRLTLGSCVALDASPRTLGKMIHSRRCLWQEHGTERLQVFLLTTPKDVGFADDDLMHQAISSGLFTEFYFDG
ncbi:hypothetical protein F5887DRAFT_334755 [Amanita rubescens]|nr:hypothetical protein F5887DRAFT_1082847 [Amanita rubescens]KAF8343311.1 hypothetical protein F5887DRAFT_334755 [Amanita rubescens]